MSTYDEVMAVKGPRPASSGDDQRIATAVSRAQESLEQVLAAVAERSSMTVTEFADRFNVSEEALAAFAEAVRELLGGRELDVQSARRAGLLAAATSAWEDALGPMLSSAQVRKLLGGVMRQRVDELLRQRRLIGVQSANGRRHFPAFQFGDGRLPTAPLVDAFWNLADEPLDPWSAASWCVTQHDQLDGTSPLEWVGTGGDTDRLGLAAGRDAARLSR